MSFNIPVVTSLRIVNIMGTDPSLKILILGQHFGACVIASDVLYPNENFRHRSARLSLTACPSTDWLSDSSVACLALAAGVGFTNTIVLTAAASVGSITEVFSVDNPRISAQQRNHPASSAMSILAHGNSFGTFDSTTIFRIKETATEATS